VHTKISDVDELRRYLKSEWTVWSMLFIDCAVGEVASASTCLRCWRQTFRAYDCKDDVTYYTFDDFRQVIFVALQWFIKCTCKYCVDGSICHFKFSKALLAHILGEVGTFCIALLSISSRTRLSIFTEIDSYLTNTEQKISWHVFFWDKMYNAGTLKVKLHSA